MSWAQMDGKPLPQFPQRLDGYAYAVTDGVHILLRRSTLAAE